MVFLEGSLIWLLGVFGTAVTSYNECDPSQYIISRQTSKECLYKDPQGRLAIGIGFKLEIPGARELLKQIGADYEAIINGPATDVKTACSCQNVTCLTNIEIKSLFGTSIFVAMNTAHDFISDFSTLCCNVQNAVVDMAFDLGSPVVFQTQMKWFSYFLGQMNFQAAGDDLLVTKYCNVPASMSRCLGNEALVRTGCKCSSTPRVQTCSKTTACCNTGNTCCTEKYTMREYLQKNVTISWCCPDKQASCCGTFCCAANYPVCCTDGSGRCCPAGTTCKAGRCYSEYGTEIVEGERGKELR